MKIFIANKSTQKIGGGWSFISNLTKYLKYKVEFIKNIADCDIFFIPSASMVSKENVDKAKKLKKKIILRVDNILKDSNNRGCGMSRLKKYADMADMIVWQCNWTKDYIGWWLKKEGIDINKKSQIIYNGVDTEIFNPKGQAMPKSGYPQYLYVRYGRDEQKQWHQAWYEYQMIQRKNLKAHLWLVGKWSSEIVGYNFDFFVGEKYKYWGIVEDRNLMAQIYRGTDILLAPYYNDCFSQTMLEAAACGCHVECNNTGGNLELMQLKDISAKRMAEEYFNLFNFIL